MEWWWEALRIQVDGPKGPTDCGSNLDKAHKSVNAPGHVRFFRLRFVEGGNPHQKPLSHALFSPSQYFCAVGNPGLGRSGRDRLRMILNNKSMERAPRG